MNKLNSKRIKWLGNRARRQLKWLRRRNGAIPPKKAYILIDGHVRTAYISKPVHCFPEIMCNATNAQDTLTSLRYLRSNLALKERGRLGYRPERKRADARIQKLSKHYDFTKIKYLNPTAALLLAAEFSRVHLKGMTKPWFVDFDKLEDIVLHIPLNIGFFDFFGMTDLYSEERTAQYERLKVIPIRSGLGTDARGAAELTADLFSLFPLNSSPQGEAQTEVKTALYGAMIEAMVNVQRHAFDGPHRWNVKPQRKWWASGTTDVDRKIVTAAIYDDGATIPITLPKSRKWDAIRSQLTRDKGEVLQAVDPKRDAEAIIAATMEGQTSTLNDHNGKGLHQVVEFINSCKAGYVRITSRFGVAEFRPRQKPTGLTNRESIGGTLIEWSVEV